MTLRNKWWMTLWVVALLLSGCPKRMEHQKSAGGQRSGDYYPLAVGNRWTYDATFLGEKRQQVVEIKSQQEGFFLDSQGGQLTVDGFGVRDQKRYLLRDPVEQGREWTNVVSVSSVEHYKILDVGYACEVPAGRFEGCIRVEGRNRVDPQTTLVNELTFAPGVGLVKIEVYAQAGDKRIPQTQLALREFQLAGSKN